MAYQHVLLKLCWHLETIKQTSAELHTVRSCVRHVWAQKAGSFRCRTARTTFVCLKQLSLLSPGHFCGRRTRASPVEVQTGPVKRLIHATEDHKKRNNKLLFAGLL